MYIQKIHELSSVTITFFNQTKLCTFIKSLIEVSYSLNLPWQFSPTSEHILLAYGRRHSSLLKSVVIDGETTVPIYTILEVRFCTYLFNLYWLDISI